MKIRKTLLILATVLTTSLTVFGFTACEGSGSEHEHAFGEWTITQEAT